MIRWEPINSIFIFLSVFFIDNIMGGGSDDCSSFDEKYSIKAGVKLVICVTKLNGFMNPFAIIIIIVIIICFSLFCSAFYIAIYFPKITNHPFVHLFVTLPIFYLKTCKILLSNQISNYRSFCYSSISDKKYYSIILV